MNPMRNIRIEKITLNIGTGKEQPRLEKGMNLLKTITGIAPVKTTATKRIPGWGLRPGLPIGCKLTLRKKAAKQLLIRLLEAKDNILSPNQFDSNGNLAFGLAEYIDIPDVKYDPEIGMMGLEVCITLERPGFRVKRRKLKQKKIPVKHKITKQEAIDFMSKEFNIKVGEEE
ncbi:50S ribosomal protein L5 [Candidatus Woesearchaeota archaeon]|nr:50S ribosomal protein L5 [Candidatus Woesearchaeota archaeon]